MPEEFRSFLDLSMSWGWVQTQTRELYHCTLEIVLILGAQEMYSQEFFPNIFLINITKKKLSYQMDVEYL